MTRASELFGSDQETGEWADILVPGGWGSVLKRDDGLEVFVNNVSLGVFTDDDDVSNAIFDYWNPQSNGGDPHSRENEEPSPTSEVPIESNPVSDPLTIARGYLKRDWNPIPVSRQTKNPIGKGWQHRRLDSNTVAQAFNRADMNVGVQLGPMSGGLTDVDLDCPEAVAIGPMLLPNSNNIFGRPSKRRSHWLYSTTVANTINKANLQFKDTDGTMMLELRIGGGGKGSQSVFPGSVHESGEAIEWDQDGVLVTVDDEELLQQIRRLAVAAILARHWPTEGSRHDAALTVGGFLARAGFNEADVVLMLEAIATAAGDEQEADRVQAARDAIKQHENGGETRGLPMLVETFGAKVADKVAEWLDYALQEPRLPEGVKLGDFCAYLPDHSYIFTPTGTFWATAGVNACLGPGANKRIDRNQPVHHLTWAPGHPMLIENRLVIDDEWVERNGVTTFNMYRPPVLKHGDPSKAGPWLELVHKVYPEDAERLIPKLAHRVKRPQEKINHAVVMGGPPGIGKDTILEPVRRAVGAWNWRETSPQQILGRFNGFLQSVIMRINEVRDLGEFNRYQFYEHTKPFFAAPPKTLRVDEKNIPEHDVMNVTFAILTTNRTSGIFLPPDDRRHDVLWSKLTKHDFTEDYWIKMWKWYDEGGDSHVAAYLATLDISAFNPKAPPPLTEAFWTIVNANRAPEEGELQDLLDQLGNPDAVTINQIIKAASGTKHADIRTWLQARRNRPSIPHRFDAAGYAPVNNEAATSGLWVVGGERQVVYAKKDLMPRDRLAAVATLRRKADEEATTAVSREVCGGGQPAARPGSSPPETELDRNVVELLKRPKK